MRKFGLNIALPVGVLIILTFVIRLTDADRQIARFVWGQDQQWPGISRFPWNFLYTYAPLPAFLTAGWALMVFVAGYFSRTFKRSRGPALFLILLLGIGPGLLVNVILKDNLGRARPSELVEFGGHYEFTEIWQAGEAGPNSSFPCGHASVAFYMLAPWFIYRHRKRKRALAFLVGGILFGSLVGAARILQGGHFLSDVLWAGGLVYLCGEVLAFVLNLESGPKPDHVSGHVD